MKAAYPSLLVMPFRNAAQVYAWGDSEDLTLGESSKFRVIEDKDMDPQHMYVGHLPAYTRPSPFTVCDAPCSKDIISFITKHQNLEIQPGIEIDEEMQRVRYFMRQKPHIKCLTKYKNMKCR